jgi:hypothetical protein
VDGNNSTLTKDTVFSRETGSKFGPVTTQNGQKRGEL